MLYWRILLATLFISGVVLAAEEKKKDQPAAEARVAVVEAVPGDESEQGRSAQERQDHEEDEEEDQLALESNIEEKDGAHHEHHDAAPQAYAVAPAAPAYAAAPPQYSAAPPSYNAAPAQPVPIPVPLPVPVQPASVVLPSLPKQQYNPPQRPPPPPPSPYSPQPRPATGYQPPPPPPPQPAYQPSYQPKPVVQPAYQPAPQPSYQQVPPPPPPAYPSAAQQVPVYQPAPAQPVYQPAPVAPAQPAYQPAPVAPPQPAYQPAPVAPPQPAYQPGPVAPPQPAYQPGPVAPPQPAYQPPAQPSIPQPSYAESAPQALPQPEAAVAYPAAAIPSDPWPAPVQDMPKIVSLDVKCEKNLMKVFIEFDKPFNGIIFSKGHYANVHCVHLPAGLGRNSANFDISINSCGTTGNTENGLYGYGSQSGSGTFFENTIIIQYDPQVQEVWDQARKLRCTWHDQYEKSVTFRPFPVDMLDVVRADFAGDNVGCWMQIQVGKGPWASEVSGLVKIGQTMTMVLAIKDDDNKFDMLVRNCMAHDGKRAPIQLVDQKGCVTRPKLMSRFTKIKNFGSSASVLSYAHFQAFKFPDSMEVHFQCTIQICRYQCPDQCSGEYQQPGIEPRPNNYASERVGAVSAARPRDERRSRRDVAESEKQDVGMNRIIQVVSTGDLTFALEQTKDNTTTIVFPSRSETEGLICMTSPGFAATLVVLLAILIISCLLSAFLCIRHRAFGVDRSLVSAFANPAFAHKKGHF